MIRKFAWASVVIGYLALVWYGAAGESGPVGWLNALQQDWSGHYSRKLSFIVVCLGGILLMSPIVLPLVLTDGACRRPSASCALAPQLAKPMARWRLALVAWSVPVAVAWIAVLGYYAWDFHLRSQDARLAYQPLNLADDVPASPSTGAHHLALQGRFLWDHAIVRRDGAQSASETTFVPIVDRGWTEGRPVRFVARIDSHAVYFWRNGERGHADVVLARVDGAVPTPAFGVFAKTGATLAPAAALVIPVASEGAKPSEIAPAFDRENALLLGTVLTVVWTVSLLAIVLAVAKARWSTARRAAQPGGQPGEDL